SWYVRATPTRTRKHYKLEVGLQLGNQRFDLLPAAKQALADGDLMLEPPVNEPAGATWHAPLDDRRRAPVAVAELRALLRPLSDYLDAPGRAMRLPWGQAGRLDELAAALPEHGELDAPASLKGLAGR